MKKLKVLRNYKITLYKDPHSVLFDRARTKTEAADLARAEMAQPKPIGFGHIKTIASVTEATKADMERYPLFFMKSWQNPKRGEPTTLKCNFCGKVFKRVIGPRTYEIRCPKCREYDVEVV